jgi:hypothetical protein
MGYTYSIYKYAYVLKLITLNFMLIKKNIPLFAKCQNPEISLILLKEGALFSSLYRFNYYFDYRRVC